MLSNWNYLVHQVSLKPISCCQGSSTLAHAVSHFTLSRFLVNRVIFSTESNPDSSALPVQICQEILCEGKISFAARFKRHARCFVLQVAISLPSGRHQPAFELEKFPQFNSAGHCPGWLPCTASCRLQWVTLEKQTETKHLIIFYHHFQKRLLNSCQFPQPVLA